MYRLMAKNLIFVFVFVVSALAEQQPSDLFSRVVVTGASVTSGYGLTTPPVKGDLGAYPINMKHIMEGVITSDHDEVQLFGDLFFFKNCRKNAKEYIKKIKAYKPTLVVGVDFLFWFGHGTPPKDCNDIEAYRMERIHFVLELLGQLEIPIVIGNLPNVRDAVGKMLMAKQVPTKETLKKMNERIHAWGKSHENVTVIDVYDLWDKAMQDKEIVLLKHTWPAGSQEKLLQQDMLHTTFEGTVAASLLVADATNTNCVETDPKKIMITAAAKAREEAKTSE